MARGYPRVWEDCFVPEPNSGCWLWISPLNGGGYGSYRGTMAHRWSYERYTAAIPPGLTIDHLCKTRCCVNPDHLEAVTYRVNNHRSNSMSGRHARATHCPKGHPYDKANTYIRPDGTGRGCLVCRRASAVRQNAKAKAARQARKRITAL